MLKDIRNDLMWYFDFFVYRLIWIDRFNLSIWSLNVYSWLSCRVTDSAKPIIMPWDIAPVTLLASKSGTIIGKLKHLLC
jgi:hypothetical protein